MYWGATGKACLCLATNDTDATNQSYYGESKLIYLPADPARADAACGVELPKEGPVHDVAWSPVGDYFCVVAGNMPAKVSHSNYALLYSAAHAAWSSGNAALQCCASAQVSLVPLCAWALVTS